MSHFTEIRQFQIVQVAENRVHVLVVLNGQGPTDIPLRVPQAFSSVLGPAVQVTAETVGVIPPPPGSHWAPTVRSLQGEYGSRSSADPAASSRAGQPGQ
jgi:hypothetical protein